LGLCGHTLITCVCQCGFYGMHECGVLGRVFCLPLHVRFCVWGVGAVLQNLCCSKWPRGADARLLAIGAAQLRLSCSH
jgi:hypothetical protein